MLPSCPSCPGLFCLVSIERYDMGQRFLTCIVLLYRRENSVQEDLCAGKGMG
jgi:hypothetical protein